MPLKRISLTLLLLTAFAVTSCGQTEISIPKHFVETVPPKVSSEEWFKLNHSHNEFGVSVMNRKLVVEKVREVNKCELHITGGTLTGINKGEWGGTLTFTPDDNPQEIIHIKRGNIKFIFNFKNKIYFIEGLAHLTSSSGAMFELNLKDKNFSFTKIIDFEDAPEAFTIYDDKILIATSENFYVVQDFKKELVFKEAFWSGLYPNSVAVFDDKNVFLGIRSGIVKLDLTTKRMKFYRYKGL